MTTTWNPTAYRAALEQSGLRPSEVALALSRDGYLYSESSVRYWRTKASTGPKYAEVRVALAGILGVKAESLSRAARKRAGGRK